MSDSLAEIGGFQFANLVQNRIPFILVNLGASTAGLFPSFHQGHLDKVTLNSTTERALGDLQSQKVPQDQAVVILCENGEASGRLCDQIIAAGYHNAYFVGGGLNRIKIELSS